ncbi:MAG TPA: DUF3159 domain-containing protein [Solirubrobacterales bacterium]|nr:DUF3159 domain-containing protein [Solirubrobacterales bacterium]
MAEDEQVSAAEPGGEEKPRKLDDTVASGKVGGVPLSEAVGGPLGVAEATLPFIAFTIAWQASDNDVVFGALVAVGISAALAAARLIKGESTQFAISGLIGIAIGAIVAARTGEASTFFLPGILINFAWLAGYLTSIVIRRPLIGYFVSFLTPESGEWQKDPKRVRVFTLASWIWVGLFSLRIAIQLPLYLSDSVGPLAAARVVTGLPLFALGLWLTYLLLQDTLEEAGGLRIQIPGGRG